MPGIGLAQLPQVHILATGGTIAATDSGMLTAEELIDAVPELADTAALSVENFSSIGSSRMTPELQHQLAQRVNELFTDDALAGVVITHGTDSLEETAFLLDLLIADARPVVFTAAQRSPRRSDTDGPRNLLNAVLIAADARSTGRGVMITLNDDIHAARFARKTHTTAVEAFQSIGFGKLGYLDEQHVYFTGSTPPRITLIPASADSRVDLVRLVAGSDGTLVRAAVAAGAKGLVLEVFGRGNVPPLVTEALREAVAAGVIVVFTSRTGDGRTLIYPEFSELAIVNGENLDGLKARMLLIAALGQSASRDEIQEYFTTLSGY